MSSLLHVAPGVLVRTSEYCTTTTTIVVDDGGGCLVIDPAVTPADLAELAAELAARRLTVVAGFATHPHWDHVLWSSALGPAPRFATATAVAVTRSTRSRMLDLVERQAPGHDLDLLGALTPLPAGASTIPWDGPPVDVIEHSAHAPGHAAAVVRDAGVLVAGDMCSDIEIPLLDLSDDDPVGAYRHALDLLAERDGIRHVVPGHGHVGDATELADRIGADLDYLAALSGGGFTGDAADDPRLTEEWLLRDHRAQIRRARDSGANDDPSRS